MSLHIKYSHAKDEWIVFDPRNFKRCHTHVKHKRIALKIRDIVEHKRMPNSVSKSFVVSCIRVTGHNPYKKQLINYLESLGGKYYE